jgi:hypothetical protein
MIRRLKPEIQLNQPTFRVKRRVAYHIPEVVFVQRLTTRTAYE